MARDDLQEYLKDTLDRYLEDPPDTAYEAGIFMGYLIVFVRFFPNDTDALRAYEIIEEHIEHMGW